MKPNELYNLVDSSDAITGLDDFQWAYKVDDNEKIIYVAFQGSKSVLDYIFDILAFKVKLYKGQENYFKVHFGYKKVWKDNNDQVEDKILELTNHYNGYFLIFAGHSYGGDIAQLAAEDYHYRSGKKANLITFGAPRMLGDKKTQEYFRSCINDAIQYEHIDDPMPKLFLGFYNTVDKTKKVGVSCKKLPWIKMLFNTVKYHCSYKDESVFLDA